ncbi:MAG: DUF2934 domain-containing protein [Candidatus Omnitrophica bacterium]|nr:DUF2934 domain-containing protein [Candidatus Omnitrophota bacterium]
MALRNFNRRNGNSKRGSNDSLFDEISKLAYQFYVDRGYSHGNDTEDWLRAERIVKARFNT